MPSAKTSPNPERLLPNEPRTYTSEEIASIFFSDAKSAVLYDGRMTIVSESDNFVLPESQLSRNEESYLAGMALDTAVLSTGNQPLLIKIFISDDGYKYALLVNDVTTESLRPPQYKNRPIGMLTQVPPLKNLLPFAYKDLPTEIPN